MHSGCLIYDVVEWARTTWAPPPSFLYLSDPAVKYIVATVAIEREPFGAVDMQIASFTTNSMVQLV